MTLPGRRLSRAAMAGLLVGLAGLLISTLPGVFAAEEALGLDWLFGRRGVRPPPPQILVVSVDRASIERLGLPSRVDRWPRSVHAGLVDRLAGAGAAVIVFDIFFGDPGNAPEDDARFASSIARAGNVILARYLGRDLVPVAGHAGQLSIERLQSPLGVLADAAIGSAPFPLPKVPVRVNQYWTFKPGAGGAPSLPIVAFQVFALDAYDDFVRLAREAGASSAGQLPAGRAALVAAGPIDRTVGMIREMFQNDPGLADRMLRAQSAPPGPRRDLVGALIGMYAGADSRYLDFYGPARTIATVPYSDVVEPGDGKILPERVAGKAVFVGLSEQLRPEQKDGFNTVFSQATGVDIGGVEIAATAFGNLLERRHVEPPGAATHLGLVVAGGFVFGAGVTLLPPVLAILAGTATGLAYLAIAQAHFNASGLWLPLLVPVALQIPLGVAVSVVGSYVRASRERRDLRRIFARYVPDAVIDDLVRDVHAQGASRLVHGICLFTDGERYVSLAETMDPRALAELMNRYYAAVFEPILHQGGFISDVIGDAVLGIWAGTGPDAAARARACAAACEIAAAVDRFNRSAGDRQLPIRIGLHAGQIALGNVGALDHFEFRAFGDIVNTAHRIQELNKRLGTRTLVAADVLHGVGGFLSRRLGTFVLPGKARPLEIHELVGPEASASPDQTALCAAFAEALTAYEAREWEEAGRRFRALVDKHDDGPARFYARLHEQQRVVAPAPEWTPVITLTKG